MANTTKNLVRVTIGKEGRLANLPMSGTTHIYEGGMVAQLAATAQLVPGSTAASGQCIGVATHEVDNTGADGDKRCLIETDRVFGIANATAGDACSEATLFGSIVYMLDDQTIAAVIGAPAREIAGYFWGMEEDGKVKVWITGKAI